MDNNDIKINDIVIRFIIPVVSYNEGGCYRHNEIKFILDELINENYNVIVDVEMSNGQAPPIATVIINGKEAKRRIGELTKREILAFIKDTVETYF